MEQPDLYYASGHHHLQLSRPGLEPPGECRSILDTVRALAKRMGLSDPCFDDSFEDLVRTALDNPANPRLAGVTLERLERENSVPLTPQDPRYPYFVPFLDGVFPTPSKKVEFVSSHLAKWGVDPVLGALASEDADPRVAEEHAKWPLHFLTPASRYFLNSSMVENERGRRLQKGPFLYLHPDDAAARGIVSGDRVRVWNDRGSWIALAEVGDLTGPGVVATYRGWWSRFTMDGSNANQTTSQRLTDAGAGATFYSNFVDVAKVG
jgi:anaerobic selenocysteine-containing dehydrogenase